MAGVSAGILAQGGFTGAPAITVEGAEVEGIWSDLGRAWLTSHQDFKPYAVCYWAQPAIAGALALQRAHRLAPDAIRCIQVHTFHEAACLVVQEPATTEEAQYSLPFPVAAALVHGRLGAGELTGAALRDPLVLTLAKRLELVEDAGYSGRFPDERIARVIIETEVGETFDSGEAEALWDRNSPPTDDELLAKYRWLAREGLSEQRAAALEAAAWDCASLPDAAALLSLITPPV
jgi:2-methylcitrate dehydratase PrpD